MTTPTNPEEGRPQDLEARWEAVLRGEASPEEVAAVRRAIAEAGRESEFEVQAEVSALVRGLATRHGAPPRLRRRLAELASEERGQRRPQRGRIWWAALGGALVASLVFAVGLAFLGRPLYPARDPFAVVAKEARAEYQRAMIDPKPIQTGSTRLEKILGWFEARLPFRPRVFFPGNAETALEGGRVGYVAGAKVPNLLYRWKGERLVLVIFRAPENPLWSDMPPKKWVAMTEAAPTACIWRRGDFIYALVGRAPVGKMRELSRAITPPGKKI